HAAVLHPIPTRRSSDLRPLRQSLKSQYYLGDPQGSCQDVGLLGIIRIQSPAVNSLQTTVAITVWLYRAGRLKHRAIARHSPTLLLAPAMYTGHGKGAAL